MFVAIRYVKGVFDRKIMEEMVLTEKTRGIIPLDQSGLPVEDEEVAEAYVRRVVKGEIPADQVLNRGWSESSNSKLYIHYIREIKGTSYHLLSIREPKGVQEQEIAGWLSDDYPRSGVDGFEPIEGGVKLTSSTSRTEISLTTFGHINDGEYFLEVVTIPGQAPARNLYKYYPAREFVVAIRELVEKASHTWKGSVNDARKAQKPAERWLLTE